MTLSLREDTYEFGHFVTVAGKVRMILKILWSTLCRRLSLMKFSYCLITSNRLQLLYSYFISTNISEACWHAHGSSGLHADGGNFGCELIRYINSMGH